MDPRDNAEVEIICPHCGYRTCRTASRLRRSTPIVCAECGTVMHPSVNAREPDS